MTGSPAAAPLTDDEFRRQIRDWLYDNLSGPEAAFSDLVGVGGTGHEHEAIDRRRAWERALGGAGWIGAGWPAEHGGRDLPFGQQVIFHEEYARAGGPGRLMHMSEQLLGPTLLAFGTPEQQRRFLPGIVAGRTLWCQGYSEPEAGSDLAGVQTRALRDGDSYVLTGQKIWTSLAHLADWCFVLARTDPTRQRHSGLSYLLVPMDQPGITVRPITELTGTAEFNEVFFDGAVTAVDNRVGDEGDGWRVAMGTLGFERGVATLGQQIGFERELDRVLRTARASGALADARVRARLVDAWIGLRVIRCTGERMLRSSATGAAGPEASVSKLQWGRWHRELGELAVDVGGVAGVLTDLPTGVPAADGHSAFDVDQILMLVSRADTIYGGSDEIQRNIVAERLLGLPRSYGPKAGR